jgi:KDO2-lipid IV(A) lauroyltransferase
MLSKILYYLVIYPVSLLPFSFLYGLSNVLAFVLEYIVKYRREVMFNNLKNSFPEKSEAELKLILHKFYAHFSDLVLEGLKGFNLSEKDARKRISFEGLEDIERFYKEKRDIIFVSGHYGNWEMPGSSLSLFLKHSIVGLYKPLSNKFFDEKAKKSRSAFGVKLTAMQAFKNEN